MTASHLNIFSGFMRDFILLYFIYLGAIPSVVL
jgi:hypothetical protein